MPLAGFPPNVLLWELYLVREEPPGQKKIIAIRYIRGCNDFFFKEFNDYQPEPFFALPLLMCPSAVALLMIAAILLPALSLPVAMYLPDFTSITGSIIGTFLVFVFTE